MKKTKKEEFSNFAFIGAVFLVLSIALLVYVEFSGITGFGVLENISEENITEAVFVMNETIVNETINVSEPVGENISGLSLIMNETIVNETINVSEPAEENISEEEPEVMSSEFSIMANGGLIPNPSFENGTGADADNWTESGGVGRSNVWASNDTYAMRINGGCMSGPTPCFWVAYATQEVNLTNVDIIVFDARVDPSNGYISFTIDGLSNRLWNSSGTGTWYNQSVNVSTFTELHNITLGSWLFAPGGGYVISIDGYFDNLRTSSTIPQSSFTALSIWDETDSAGGNQTKYANDSVKFFANYTNSSGIILGANCSIEFNDSNANMTWNVTSLLHEYSRNFSAAGIYDWNASCNKTGYDNLTTIDAVTIYSPNTPPTQGTPILNSTFGTNLTTENLTVYNISTFDAENDFVKNIINWYVNNILIMILNMPFEGGSNSTFTRDYSYGNNGTVLGATWDSSSGYDGKGAYEFDGDSSWIDSAVSEGITYSAWFRYNHTEEFNSQSGKNCILDAGSLEICVNLEGKLEASVSGKGNGSWINTGQAGIREVLSLTVWNGSLYAGAGEDTTTAKIYRYNGTTWENKGQPETNFGFRTLAVWNETLYAGASNSGRVYRYDGGTTWTSTGQLGSSQVIWALAVWNGSLYGGTSLSGKVFRYDGGTTWTDLGQLGSNIEVKSLAIWNGSLYAGTYNSGKVYRYDGGTTWTDVGRLGSDTHVFSLRVWNGSLYGGGSISGKVYRYDGGTTWTDVGRLGSET
ncbi:hypothetical protein GOV06_03660, partial [Candidatus Woesearchaeota archaeon]|nr:hypothetical protein [Candidatus Woesearchaeota archaeon]